MAINTNPMLTAGQRISPEVLQRLLALRGDGWQPGNTRQQWYDPNVGKFAPVVTYDPTMRTEGVGEASSDVWTGQGRNYIVQPRNASNFGGNDVSDVWDEQGNYIGTNSGATDARNLARLAATAVGGYYGTEYLNGLQAAGAGGGLTGVDAAMVDAGAGATNVGAATAATGSGLIDAASKIVQNAATDRVMDRVMDSGWDALTRIGTAGVVAAVGGDALADPVDTSRYDALFDNLLKEQQTASQRGADLWQNYLDTWRPLEQRYAQAVAGFDTPERREDAAQRASSQVATNYDLQRQQAQSEMTRAGVDPSTMAALGASSRAWQAKDEAGAQNDARSRVELAGLDLLSGGANFGRNQVQAASDQSRISTGNTGQAANILTTQGNLQNQNTANRNALIGDLFSGATGLAGMYWSSKKKKTVGEKVHGLSAVEAVKKSPSRHWRYRPGEGDGNTKPRMGATAEDLKKAAPEVSDGKMVDGIALAGLHHAAIGNLAKRMERVEAGLGDAKKRA